MSNSVVDTLTSIDEVDKRILYWEGRKESVLNDLDHIEMRLEELINKREELFYNGIERT